MALPVFPDGHWRLAFQEELNMLRKCKVFELVDRPRDHKVIKNRWVFDVKSDGHKKARLVAKGCWSNTCIAQGNACIQLTCCSVVVLVVTN